ncbi:MAG: sirohydrochlorin cobaltochelatase [Clostridia bacterium]|jgi:sirohydrochlorin ferrochelatase|nr:sirohydrochlorin cobaltochelatase [Clostridia bacterium]
MSTGYVILGHGSRAREANESLQEITKMVKENLYNQRVISAFMGFSQPSLEDAVAELVDVGCSNIVIMPFFLYKGIHLQEDIPEKMDKLGEKYGDQASFTLTHHLGTDKRLAEIVLERIRGVN